MAMLNAILSMLAALALIIAVPVLTVRMLVLMSRMEDTRKDLAALIAESTLTLQHANRMLVRLQDGVDHLRHAVDRLEKILAFLQPASAVGGILAGARRIFSGGHPPAETPAASEDAPRDGQKK